MKEKEFLKIVNKQKKYPVYYGLDEDNNVLLDSEGMREELDIFIQYLEEYLENRN